MPNKSKKLITGLVPGYENWQHNKKYESLEIHSKKDITTKDAYIWDELIEEMEEWRDLEYVWIASSNYGDQIIVTDTSPIHDGIAVYMLGMDVAGPDSDNPIWPEGMLFLGNSVSEWLERVEKYGDEHSIGPGGIDNELSNPEEYKKLYRKLNPGLNW